MEFNETQTQIMLGSLLGDATINKDKRYEGYEFRERHSITQKDYLIWKNKNLNFNFKEHKTHPSCSITKGNKIFKEYRNLFYKNGTKTVNSDILNKIGQLGLATWHMDDGDYNYKTETIRLATHSFGLKGNQLIKNWFEEKWNIYPKIRKIYDKRWKKEYFHLELSCKDTKKYINLIKEHILPTMEYKIGLDEERRKTAKLKKKEYDKKWWSKNKEKMRKYYQSYHKKRKLENKNIYSSFLNKNT